MKVKNADFGHFGEKRPLEENMYWDFFHRFSFEDMMGDLEDK